MELDEATFYDIAKELNKRPNSYVFFCFETMKEGKLERYINGNVHTIPFLRDMIVEYINETIDMYERGEKWN